MTRKREIRNKGVGVGLRVLNNLIEAGSTRNNAEVFSTVAQSSFIEGAEWADETMLAKACEFIDSHLHIVKEDIAYTNKEFLKDFRKEMKR